MDSHHTMILDGSRGSDYIDSTVPLGFQQTLAMNTCILSSLYVVEQCFQPQFQGLSTEIKPAYWKEFPCYVSNLLLHLS